MAGMALRLHHIVVDAHDLPALARFWAQALGWPILSEREQEVVIGPDETAPVGMCFMPVSDVKTVKTAYTWTSRLAVTTGTPRSNAFLRSAHAESTSGRQAPSPGPCSLIRRGTSSAWCARRQRSSVENLPGEGVDDG
jgi:Glyoxalase-like domain